MLLFLDVSVGFLPLKRCLHPQFLLQSKHVRQFVIKPALPAGTTDLHVSLSCMLNMQSNQIYTVRASFSTCLSFVFNNFSFFWVGVGGGGGGGDFSRPFLSSFNAQMQSTCDILVTKHSFIY